MADRFLEGQNGWSQVNWRNSIYAERIVTTLSNALPFDGMQYLIILVENCGGLHVRGCQYPSSRGSGERNHTSPCHVEPGHRVRENDVRVQTGRRSCLVQWWLRPAAVTLWRTSICCWVHTWNLPVDVTWEVWESNETEINAQSMCPTLPSFQRVFLSTNRLKTFVLNATRQCYTMVILQLVTTTERHEKNNNQTTKEKQGGHLLTATLSRTFCCPGWRDVFQSCFSLTFPQPEFVGAWPNFFEKPWASRPALISIAVLHCIFPLTEQCLFWILSQI